jgi:glutamyl/glutaminyl-tRNA synthetase
VLILRNEDLDAARCRPEFVSAMYEDLRWFGLEWQEGPDCGGPFAPYSQSERLPHYRSALRKLEKRGFIYPCYCSRREIAEALQAPHQGEEEPVYPGTCRSIAAPQVPRIHHWRFRVPDGETISFRDENLGEQQFVAGKDFGDFVVWRNDDIPAYQLAVTVDDAAMEITEVVRGEDLLLSTARQILIYRALGMKPPAFFHCKLMLDERGVRLSKRDAALSLRALRERGETPEQFISSWFP